MKQITLLVVLTVLALLIFITGNREYAPAPEEPPLPMAPLPYFVPVVPVPKLDLPEPATPKKLPPGTHCLEDCPLIDPAVVEQKVRNFFTDEPILVAIAGCESKFRHYDEQGNVLTNKQGSSATGVMQIMASVHEAEAQKLGWSIRDFNGNLAYAQHLYDTQGTTPWEASRYCWGTAIVAINKGIPST